MNPAQLLAHFDRISEAPDAIPRLRGFILDLAVRGKLVEQDPKDEPASELLKQIAEERARLVKEGKIRRQALQAEINGSDIPFPLPKQWTWVRIGDVIHLVSGQHLQPGEYSDLPQSGLPYITGPADFGQDGLLITRYAIVKKAVATKDQILLTVKGAGVGKTAICELPEVAISRQLMAMTPIGWSRSYLLLTTHRLAEALKESARSLIPGISREDVDQFVFPLPPLAEQHRIIAKVDELMAVCDRLEAAQTEREKRRDRLVAASLNRLNNGADAESFRAHARFHLTHLPRLTTRPAHIQQLRQTILNLAVRGKLAPQDPNDEPASVLVKRIQEKKAQMVKEGRIRKQQLLPSLVPDEIPFELPEKWVWLRLGEIGFTQTGTTPSSNNPEYFGKYIPFLKPADLTGNIINYFGDGISKEGVEHSRLIPKDSVLMVCIGSSIGKVNVNDRDICCNQQINAVTPYLNNLTRLTSFALRADYFQKLILVNAGMGTLPIISKGKWDFLPIPLPPLPEQQRIVAKVNELMALCNRLETQLTTTQTESRRLLESALHQALAPATTAG